MDIFFWNIHWMHNTSIKTVFPDCRENTTVIYVYFLSGTKSYTSCWDSLSDISKLIRIPPFTISMPFPLTLATHYYTVARISVSCCFRYWNPANYFTIILNLFNSSWLFSVYPCFRIIFSCKRVVIIFSPWYAPKIW